MLANLLIYAVLAIVLTKRATIHIGLSEEWIARRRRRIIISWSLVFVALAMFVGGFPMLEVNDNVAPWMFLGSFFLGLFAAIYGLVSARLVTPKRITDSHIFLAGVHPDFLAGLPEFR